MRNHKIKNIKMKKILIATVALFFGLTTNAQSSFSQTASNPTGAITNASADTMTYVLSQSYNLLSVQCVYERATGTAAGTATLSSSVDGVNYVSTGTPYTVTNVASQSTIWNVETAARYLRIIVNGGTTVTATVSAKVSGSK